MVLTRKAVIVGALLVAAAVAVVRFTGLSRADGPTPADECPLFSCIFDDAGDDD